MVSSLKAANLGNQRLLRKQKVEYLLQHDFGNLRVDRYHVYKKIHDKKYDRRSNNLPEILIWAADKGDLTTVNVLILAGVDDMAESELDVYIQKLKSSFESESADIIEALLFEFSQFVGEIDEQEIHAIIKMTIGEGHINNLKLLIENPYIKLHMNKRENYVTLAILSNNYDIVSLLLDNGIKDNPEYIYKDSLITALSI